MNFDFDMIDRVNARSDKIRENRAMQARREALDAKRREQQARREAEMQAPYSSPFMDLAQAQYSQIQERKARELAAEEKWLDFKITTAALIFMSALYLLVAALTA